MRLLIFSLTYYPRFVGGAEVAVKEITDRLSPADFDFDMITLRLDSTLPKEEKIGNVRVYRVGFAKKNPSPEELVRFPLYFLKVLYPVLALKKAISLYRENHYDGFWAMMTYMGFPVVLFRLFWKKVPYVLTLQDGDPIEHIRGRARIRIVYPLFKRIFTEASVVQTISHYLAQFAKSMNTQAPVFVVPNGVDMAHFTKKHGEQELARLKGELGKKEGDTYLITTSRMVPKNASDDVIRALALLPNNVHFLILGTGPDEAKLRALARESRVYERVKFLGHIDHGRMPLYLSISDIFIRPSLSEGMGNSFIEAMAVGLPVIATHVGGITDFLFDPEKNPGKNPTGLAVDIRDPQGIARQVKRLMEEKTLREVLVQNAFTFVKDTYDWGNIAGRMEREIFTKVKRA
ncbi:MAG: glycosyltransferase family 4 protein [Parcubacteria group bacterium]|nr:glycosyltransferase family 4 protein [Parcubacteria group bacterium]